MSRVYELAQDAPGVVVGVDYHPSEGADWVEDPTSEVWRAGVVALRYMPRFIHVAFDDHVPRESVDSPGTDFGNGHAAGVYAVRPMTVTVDHVDLPPGAGSRRRRTKIARTQMPPTPEQIRTSQGCQGISTGYVIIDCAQPRWLRGNESREGNFWLNLYVMLSRSPGMRQMLIINPPSRAALERGPPSAVLQELERLGALSQATQGRVAIDRAFAGRPPRAPPSA